MRVPPVAAAGPGHDDETAVAADVEPGREFVDGIADLALTGVEINMQPARSGVRHPGFERKRVSKLGEAVKPVLLGVFDIDIKDDEPGLSSGRNSDPRPRPVPPPPGDYIGVDAGFLTELSNQRRLLTARKDAPAPPRIVERGHASPSVFQSSPKELSGSN